MVVFFPFLSNFQCAAGQRINKIKRNKTEFRIVNHNYIDLIAIPSLSKNGSDEKDGALDLGEDNIFLNLFSEW